MEQTQPPRHEDVEEDDTYEDADEHIEGRDDDDYDEPPHTKDDEDDEDVLHVDDDFTLAFLNQTAGDAEGLGAINAGDEVAALEDEQEAGRKWSQCLAFQYSMFNWPFFVFFMVAGLVLGITGIPAQPWWYVLIDFMMVPFSILCMVTKVLRARFMVYLVLIMDLVFLITTMWLVVIDLSDFLQCRSAMCSPVWKWAFYEIYYIFNFFAFGMSVWLARLCYSVALSRPPEIQYHRHLRAE
jgi:hypothetical protein